MLHHVLPPLLRERGHRDADHFPVIHGVQPQISPANGLLDGSELRGIERLDGNQLRFRRVHLRYLVQRHLRAVGVDRYSVEHVHRRAAGAHRGHCLAKIVHRFIHARLQLRIGIS